MTIASEITRLQGAKGDIKTAIVNKGVAVGDAVKLDGYAACIDAIPSGGLKSVEYFMVAGGGGGGGAAPYSSGGGGGAGGLRAGNFVFDSSSICVIVGTAGCAGAQCLAGGTGGTSLICASGKTIRTYGGGGGGTGLCNTGCAGKIGGSGGGAGGGAFCYSIVIGGHAYGCAGEMGTSGGTYVGCGCCNRTVGSGGGGATGSGLGNESHYCDIGNCNTCCNLGPGWGGKGFEGTRGGKTMCVAGGGGGGVPFGANCKWGCGKSGGGNGGVCTATAGSAATTCGSGGGGGGVCSSNRGAGGAGAKGLVIIGYNCECKDCNGFTSATGGDSCYVCNGMKYHCFTSNGTFTIVS